MKNTPYNYGSVAKFLHWLIFFLVLGMLLVGFFMDDIGDKHLKDQIVTLHMLTGLLVLGLMIIRLLWAWINPKPQLPSGSKRWERVAEHAGQGLLYLLLIVMPLSGWLMRSAAGKPPTFFHFFAMPMPGIAAGNPALKHLGGTLHLIIAWAIITMVSLHVLAAFWHHFIKKDDILLRMLPEKKREV